MGFFGRGRVSEPQKVEDFVPIAIEVRRKKALQRDTIQAQQQIDSLIGRESDIGKDADSIIESVATQIRDTLAAQKMSLPEENSLQHMTLDESTQIIIPLYLRGTDIFRKALKKQNEETLRESLFLGEINEEMVKVLTGIDIQLQSGETSITTQMYQRMNINENVGTLGDYILSPHKLYLKHVS